MSESKPATTGDIATALTVRLGEALHAIPIRWIEEVLPALPVESVPQCPVFVRGVVFVRGHLIPVIDAAERLGLKDHRRVEEPHIVCLRFGERMVGLEVDEALDLLDVAEVESLDAKTLGAKEGFFAGVVQRDASIIRLLNPARLVDEQEAAELERVPQTA